MRNEFTVNIAYAFADIKIDQVYRNTTDKPIPTVFVMQQSDTFSLAKIDVVFYDENGNVKGELETEVYERNEAEKLVTIALANHETAALATTTGKTTSIYLGNFPAKTKAHLRAHCL